MTLSLEDIADRVDPKPWLRNVVGESAISSRKPAEDTYQAIDVLALIEDALCRIEPYDYCFIINRVFHTFEQGANQRTARLWIYLV